MLETSDRKLNLTMVNMLKAPAKMVDNIHKLLINRRVIFEERNHKKNPYGNLRNKNT